MPDTMMKKPAKVLPRLPGVPVQARNAAAIDLDDGGYEQTSPDFWVAPGRHFRIRHLEIFWAVMRTGTQYEASRLLGMSQPAVSKLLRLVEDQVGMRLFRRDKGRLVPTAEAMIFFGAVEDVFARVEAAERLARDLKRRFSGEITIAASSGLGSYLAPKLTASFLKAQPAVTMGVKVLPHLQVVDRLAKMQADIGIVYGPLDATVSQSMELCRAEIVCRFPEGHALSDHEAIGLSELAEQKLITATFRPLWSQTIEHWFSSEGLSRNIVVDCSSSEVCYQLADEGVGIAVVPMLPEHPAMPTSPRLRSLSPRIHVPVLALYNTSHENAHLAEALIAHLRKICSGLRWTL